MGTVVHCSYSVFGLGFDFSTFMMLFHYLLVHTVSDEKKIMVVVIFIPLSITCYFSPPPAF